MNPQHPVFIPTKGRHDSRKTIKMMQEYGIPFTIFVEAQEAELYAPHVTAEQLHVVPHQNKGVTVTRNYMWNYAAELGHEWYWSFDDNINAMGRFNHNCKVHMADGTLMAVIEQFAARYDNLAICGMNYDYFIPRKYICPPYTQNTRIYSNMLIRTFATNPAGRPYRFATFYNEDTDLCLRVLKDGWCTVLFNAFLVFKAPTMTIKGGNTDFYKQTEKRLEFAKELAAAHPDIVEVVERYGRWHHQVDYSGFNQPLKLREGITIPSGINNHGMELVEFLDGRWQKSDAVLSGITGPKKPVYQQPDQPAELGPAMLEPAEQPAAQSPVAHVPLEPTVDNLLAGFF